MKMAVYVSFVLIVAAFLTHGCGGGAGGSAGEDVSQDAGLDGGPQSQDAGRTDAGRDVGLDAGTDVGLLAVPYMPPKPAAPYVDVPYLQEYNHTTNEVEDGIGPLVAVVIPPSSYSGFDTPTQVTPRGFIKHKQGGGFDLVRIPDADPDLIGAAASSDAIVLAGSKSIYWVKSDATIVGAPAPADVTVARVASGVGIVYILTDKGVSFFTVTEGAKWESAGVAVTAAHENGATVYVGTSDSIYAVSTPYVVNSGSPKWALTTADGLTAIPVKALVANVTLPQPLDVVVIGEGEAGVQGIRVENGVPKIVSVAEFAQGRVPLWHPGAAAKASDGGFVVATSGGAMRVMDRGFGMEWRVYNAERWLPSEDVRGVAADPSAPDGPIWFATAGGLATVTAKRITIEEKMGPFVDRVVQRHDRDGAVADSHLTKKGDLSTNIPWDSDNDGSWTSYWLLAECFRYKVTGEADAKAHFDESLDAMLRLRDVTGTDWFLARSVIRVEGCRLDDCDNPDDGNWYKSPDGKWWVKRDTSNDEVMAHMFMMGHAYDLCADEAQKKRIAAHMAGIIGGIMDHGWQLLDPITNRVTTYGQFDPAYVNDNWSGQYGDGGVRSSIILGALDLAHYLTGEQRFLDGKNELVEKYGYADNVLHTWDHPFHQGNGDGDEMGSDSQFALLRYETDPAVRRKCLDGFAKTWTNALSLHQAAWWTMVDAVVGDTGWDGEIPRFVARWLQLAPVDFIRWDQHNSHRRDLVPAPKPYKDGGMRSDGFIIPYDERRNDRWNTDQFRVDGGMGAMIEMDGADVLAPYWMARYYGFIVPQ